MGALRKLDKSAQSTIRMAEVIRPRAQLVFDRLKADVPKAYQEHSSAHPYLPFFHRLEGVLKGLATFDPTDDDVVCLDDDSDVEEVLPTPVKSEASVGAGTSGDSTAAATTTTGTSTTKASGRSSKRPSISGKSDDDTVMGDPKRMKREDSTVSALSGFDAAFGSVLAGLAEEDETGGGNDGSLQSTQHSNASGGGGGGGGNTKEKPAPVTIDLLDSSDEEEEADSKPAAVAAAPAAAGTSAATDTTTAQAQSTSTDAAASKGWRCPQCTFLNSADSTACKFCDDEDDADFESDPLLKALIDGTFADDFGASNTVAAAATSPSAAAASRSSGHSASTLSNKVDGVIAGFESSMHFMLRPVEVDTKTDHWNDEANYVWILKLLKMMMQKADARSFLHPPDPTELFLAGYPPYESIVKHPVCFSDIVLALTNSTTSGSHLWGDGKVASLPKLNLWEGKQLLESIDIVMLNALVYYGGGRDDAKYTSAKMLRSYYWQTLDEKAQGNKSVLPRRRKPSDAFIVKK
mmetsp:Transcript_6121/g.11596  ORF Transcript_6121/g.11596 Transcript_6121/m.11596 type:complete len:521 (+) Transcript_6121:3-1565(+)